MMLASGRVKPGDLGDNLATKEAALEVLASVDSSDGKYVHTASTSMREIGACCGCKMHLAVMFYAQEMPDECTKELCSKCAAAEELSGVDDLMPCSMVSQETVVMLREHIVNRMSNQPAPDGFCATEELSAASSGKFTLLTQFAPKSICRALITNELAHITRDGRDGRDGHDTTDSQSYQQATEEVSAALGTPTQKELEEASEAEAVAYDDKCYTAQIPAAAARLTGDTANNRAGAQAYNNPQVGACHCAWTHCFSCSVVTGRLRTVPCMFM